jgi:hypothetical protein|uniref:Uncharacterized protein n=1 Tax=Bionectria ochroleuca TaxID=29856 RepID=A0A0B7KLD5_BIOOC
MPFATQGLNVLPNYSSTAFLALGGTALSTLGLTLDTPCITIFLDMCHPMFEGITTLGTEEMTVVPVFSQRHNMLAKNRSLAMLAPWRIQLMPVKVAEKPESIVSVLSHGHTWSLIQDLTSCTTTDPINTLRPYVVRLRTDLHCL